ncbi:predicted protein [Histoplasma mississippiense (nom. inval.)]|uniref:predicted protein n=1 Tax=Ajellomyces capsulatus (strain NAm1 / WU24) TaxID=2059318 RepID=UPI000157CB18|nr:predicted protein [Histoplasma mississippiense (nom. inval.)]EDN09151.1 predicted protein [Histoplasma mississippiense (nom. inval.)]
MGTQTSAGGFGGKTMLGIGDFRGKILRDFESGAVRGPEGRACAGRTPAQMKCGIFAIGPRKEIVTMAVSLGGSKGDATHIAQAQQALRPSQHARSAAASSVCARNPTDRRGFKTKPTKGTRAEKRGCGRPGSLDPRVKRGSIAKGRRGGSEANQAVSEQRLDDSAGAGSKTGEGRIRRHHPWQGGNGEGGSARERERQSQSQSEGEREREMKKEGRRECLVVARGARWVFIDRGVR